jgi:hypothetical protein
MPVASQTADWESIVSIVLAACIEEIKRIPNDCFHLPNGMNRTLEIIVVTDWGWRNVENPRGVFLEMRRNRDMSLFTI